MGLPAMLVAGVLGGAATAALTGVAAHFAQRQRDPLQPDAGLCRQYLLIYLVSGPWRDPQGFGFPQTAMFPDAAATPILVAGTGVHLGCLVAPLGGGRGVGADVTLDARASRSASSAKRRAPRASPASATSG